MSKLEKIKEQVRAQRQRDIPWQYEDYDGTVAYYEIDPFEDCMMEIEFEAWRTMVGELH